jgi:hypothetical protein
MQNSIASSVFTIGAFSTITTFVPKIALVATTALPLAFVAAAGFVKSEEWLEGCEEVNRASCPIAPQPQPEKVRLVIQAIFCCAPLILTLVSCYIKLFFPIKSKILMDEIQKGILLHEADKPAFDPITKKWVSPVPVEGPANQSIRWLLDHFESRLIKRYCETRSMKKLKEVVGLELLIGTLLLVGSVIVTGVSLKFLDHPTKSWIPTLASIVAGASLTFVMYVTMRLRAVFSLDKTNLCQEEQGRTLIESYLTRIGPKCDKEGNEQQAEIVGKDQSSTPGSEAAGDIVPPAGVVAAALTGTALKYSSRVFPEIDAGAHIDNSMLLKEMSFEIGRDRY